MIISYDNALDTKSTITFIISMRYQGWRQQQQQRQKYRQKRRCQQQQQKLQQR